LLFEVAPYEVRVVLLLLCATVNPVEFEVYREGEAYRIVPILDDKGLRLANLPKELRFVYKERKVISLHGEKDGNLHVMQDVYAVLSDLNFKTL